MSTSFNVSKDKLGWYFEQARDGTPDIKLVLLKSSGLESDATIADHDTLSALLAAANDECDFTNYVRKTLASPTRTVEDSNERVLLGGAAAGVALQVTWTTAGGATNNTIGALVLVYDPTPGAPTDSTMVPLLKHDITATTTGIDFVVTVHADGFVRVKNP